MLTVRAGSTILTVIVHIMLARLLGASEYGVFAIALSILSIAQIFAKHGFDAASARFVGMYAALGRHALLHGYLRASWIVPIVGGVAIGAILVFGTPWIAPVLTQSFASLIVIAALLPLYAFVQVRTAVSRSLGRETAPDLVLSLGQPLALVLGLPLAIIAFGMPATAVTALSLMLVGTVGTIVLQQPLYARAIPAGVRASKAEYKWNQWLRTAPAVTLFASGPMLLIQVNTVILGSLSSPAEAALYGIAGRLSSVLQIAAACLIAVASPTISRLAATEERRELQSLVLVTTRVMFALSVLGIGVFAIMGDWLLSWFSSEFAPGYPSLILLSFAYGTSAATICAGMLLTMTGYHSSAAKAFLAMLGIEVLLSLVLVPAHGALGASMSTCVALAVGNGAMAVLARRRTGISTLVRLWPIPSHAGARRSP